jgi:hypothetical protein
MVRQMLNKQKDKIAVKYNEFTASKENALTTEEDLPDHQYNEEEKEIIEETKQIMEQI